MNGVSEWERRQIERALERGLRRCGLPRVQASLPTTCALVADTAVRLRLAGDQPAHLGIEDARAAVPLALHLIECHPPAAVKLWHNALGWRANECGPYEQKWMAVAVGWAIQRLVEWPWPSEAEVAAAFEGVTAPACHRQISL